MKCKLCGNKIVYKGNEKYEICTNCLNKPFEITSICRADLAEKFEDKLSLFDDGDMTTLASKMADAYCDSGFWIDMPIIVEYILENRGEK